MGAFHFKMSPSRLDCRKLARYRRRTTAELVASLRPGRASLEVYPPGRDSLKAYPNGGVVDGQHRLTVLCERGFDIDQLPFSPIRCASGTWAKTAIVACWAQPHLPDNIVVAGHPRGGDGAEDDVRAWKAKGVDIVICLLTADEVRELDLDSEEAACRRHGIDFRGFPIPDRGVPSSRDAALKLADDLACVVGGGKRVVVHCRQGFGRSAIIVAAALVRAGWRADRALAAVEEARGCPVPDTPEQRAWVEAVPSVGG